MTPSPVRADSPGARLRSAVDKARAGNVPNDTIKRSIQKGAGELEGESYEDLVYEVYGPGGTAVVVEILTDNRNRTAGEIRKLLERFHGKLAAAGAVMYLFHKQGHILFDREPPDKPENEIGVSTVAISRRKLLRVDTAGHELARSAGSALEQIAQIGIRRKKHTGD